MNPSSSSAPPAVPAAPVTPLDDAPQLARRLGLFDATMIVMGGIVGSGIFVTPYVVARQVHTPALIVGAWLAGGLIALAGAFVYAELAARRPRDVGGQYAYLRDAFHPAVAFVYGWALLLVIQTGGMAAVAVTFARYFREVTHVPLGEPVVAALGIALLVAVNCMGVRSGGTVQNALMVLKILAILGLVAAGLLFVGANAAPAPAVAPAERTGSLLLAFGAAMTPVMFSYGGWQTASFVAGEMRNPRRDLARGLLIGVLGVIALYVGVTLACIHALGADGLAATTAPASSVMRLAFGERGATLIAAGIAISTLGFLSQGMLTAPRVYFAMAADGLFFRSVAAVSPTTRAPVVAIVLQGVLSLLIALSGTYEQILSYVVAVDWVFFALTGAALFVFRRRANGDDGGGARVPGHPLTTGLFIAAAALIVVATVLEAPVNSAVGLGIMLTGVPVYLLWRRRAA
ncbi:APC family permease [Longimicrobium sp.]|uniref:APC family permease n=1 Tax=Longimicrobium sp. TaxID=2029185 RepID=UPI002E32A662|nr:amino acid permease [Longimicrobium sp.]HEX6042250.1 amino acid permease [Longimicrobium sp.]